MAKLSPGASIIFAPASGDECVSLDAIVSLPATFHQPFVSTSPLASFRVFLSLSPPRIIWPATQGSSPLFLIVYSCLNIAISVCKITIFG
jgi:hypothetical protein